MILRNIFYERRDYESVDENLSYVTKNDDKRNSGTNGLKESEIFPICFKPLVPIVLKIERFAKI